MSATTALPQLLQIPITDLPIRVKKEVFPIFKQTLTPETHIAIGVSSGCDSMTLICLLLLYYQQQKRDLKYLHILHCNHKIRKQSEIEADYLTKFFSSIDLQIFERSSNLLTTEKALREWRYSCFRQACEEFPLPKENAPERGKGFQTALLFLGHHLEDRIESTFLNCIRGAGLKGFLNMQILQPHPLLDNEGNVCRPLLNITKNQILAFCEQFHIQYFEDESNKNLETSQRNFLRHEILEKLTNMNNGNSNFLESMKNIYQQMETLEDSPY
ncbi:MAG: tRNA lysidine(34) synthetase TilS [Candidatus Peribacteria bacterium]|jgi:tRNA(Ile)-lysidine synthase|nr:tRNA lysidine(34) synthetase TilS [Candidatus Peribacteria bacterium]